MAKREAKEISFEDLYTELEATIEKLEAGNLSLDDALVLYERGMALAKQCNAMLDRAELRIQELAPAITMLDDVTDDSEFVDEQEDE